MYLKQHVLEIKVSEVNSIKRIIGRARGITFRDILENECNERSNNSCEDDTTFGPDLINNWFLRRDHKR